MKTKEIYQLVGEYSNRIAERVSKVIQEGLNKAKVWILTDVFEIERRLREVLSSSYELTPAPPGASLVKIGKDLALLLAEYLQAQVDSPDVTTKEVNPMYHAGYADIRVTVYHFCFPWHPPDKLEYKARYLYNPKEKWRWDRSGPYHFVLTPRLCFTTARGIAYFRRYEEYKENGQDMLNFGYKSKKEDLLYSMDIPAVDQEIAPAIIRGLVKELRYYGIEQV